MNEGEVRGVCPGIAGLGDSILPLGGLGSRLESEAEESSMQISPTQSNLSIHDGIQVRCVCLAYPPLERVSALIVRVGVVWREAPPTSFLHCPPLCWGLCSTASVS